MEIEAEIGPELLQEERSSAAPAPRGRPSLKGQSGNPQGRPRQSGPSRAHKAAYVAHSLFDRKTMRLVERAIGSAESGDKVMLRAYLHRIVPPRPEVPVWLNVPAIESRRDVAAALRRQTGHCEGRRDEAISRCLSAAISRSVRSARCATIPATPHRQSQPARCAPCPGPV